jgi:parallel beta-helix repeat protein
MRLQLDPLAPNGVSIAPEPQKATNKGGFAGSPDITRVLKPGTNVTFTGNGTQQYPYVVNTTGVVQSFNVKDYGATGDGTTDDTTAVQNAINAAQVSGGTVYFPQGTYVVQLPQITTGGITLQGTGWDSVILLAPSSLLSNGQTIGLWVNGASNVVIKDLCIDGNFANIAKNGTYQTASALWTPVINKYGAQGPKTYIYANTGVDQSTYLAYRVPIRITNASSVLVENCLLQNSISAGVLVDATSVNGTDQVMIRNNRVRLTWDNGIYFHKGVNNSSAIGNHVSDTQYCGLTNIYCQNIVLNDNVIHDAGPSQSDSAGIEICGATLGSCNDNLIYHCMFDGITVKNTNETAITGGLANGFARSYDLLIANNTISDCHNPSYPSSIAYGINITAADRTVIDGNTITLADYGIQIGDMADGTDIRNNHINQCYGWGIVNGNSPDVTNTHISNNVVENCTGNGMTIYAPATITGNIVHNNGQEGIDLIPPPTGLPYKTDYVEYNVISDNGYNGVHAEAGAGNLAVVRSNEFYNSDSLTFLDGVANGTTTFTSATANFSSQDVGAVIVIDSAGSSSGDTTLTTTIASVTNSTTVVLAAAASLSRSGLTFTLYRAKNIYFDGSLASGNLTSATAKFTSSDVGKTILLYSTDGPSPSLLSTLTISSVTSSTVAVLSGSPGTLTNMLFVIKRGYGKQARALYISNSSDVHYINNHSWMMSTENYPKGAISNNSVFQGNYDFGSNTSNSDPLSGVVLPIASSQNFTAFPGAKDCVFQMNAASGALNVFLPDTRTVPKGQVYYVKKIDSSANAVTVNGTSSQTVDGGTVSLTTHNQAVQVISDGTNWQVIGKA